MRLSGGCSNQSQLAVVRRAAEARSKLTIASAGVSTRQPVRLRLGAIQGAMVNVLSKSDGPLSPREIRILVESRLQRDISMDTVYSFLRIATRSEKWPAERIGLGRYVSHRI